MEVDEFKDLDDRSLLQFNFMSAGLANYLPSIDGSQHFSIYKRLLNNLDTAFADIEDTGKSGRIKIIEESYGYFESCISQGPLFVVTFHTGSYRLVNFLLAKRKVPISILMNKIALREQGPIYSELSKAISGDENLLKLIDSDSPKSAMSILRAVKDERVIIVYIDGNAGFGERASENKNSVLINFLQGKLYVRGGIGYLAYRASVPILPVLSQIDSRGDNIIQCFPTIAPMPGQNQQEFEQSAIQKIFDHAATLIEQSPDQWEGWFYIHRSAFIKNNNDEEEALSAMDFGWYKPKKYGVFKMGETKYLMHKQTYTFQEINDSLYNKLLKIKIFD